MSTKITLSQLQQVYNKINGHLGIQQAPQFSLKILQKRQWYIMILSQIFSGQVQQIKQTLQFMKNQKKQQVAIDKFLQTFVNYGIFQDSPTFKEIRGIDFVFGSKDKIYNALQHIQAFAERTESQFQRQQGQGQYQEQGQQSSEQLDHDMYTIGNGKQFLPQVSNNKQYNQDRQNHSVMGNNNQFQNQQSQEQSNKKGYNSKPYNKESESQDSRSFQNVFSGKKNKNKGHVQQHNKHEQQHKGKTLNRYKSQQNLIKTKNTANNNTNTNFNKSSKNIKKSKKLVSHPIILKEYPKATNNQQKKLTKQIKKTIKQKRKTHTNKQNKSLKQLTIQQPYNKKKRELNNILSQTKKQQKVISKVKALRSNGLLQQKNNQKLRRLLKWKQNNLQRQKKQLQYTMQMKVQLKKQNYIKQINNLILNLQKKRTVQKKRQQNQKLKKQKQLANKRLDAIQMQYRTQMKLLREKSQQALNRKGFKSTDHRSIIQSLENQLKRENQKQISEMKLRFRREEVQLEDDLQRLQNQIVRAYKNN